MSCVFCDKIDRADFEWMHAGQEIGLTDVVRFEPLNPVTPGHQLFVPVDHVEWEDESDPHGARVGAAAAVYFATAWGTEWYRTEFNLITSNGSAATQTIPHIHIHFVPRREGDGLHLPWTGQVK